MAKRLALGILLVIGVVGTILVLMRAFRTPAGSQRAAPAATGSAPPVASAAPSLTDKFADLRHAMVSQQIEARDVKDPDLLEVMRRVPRHQFVPPDMVSKAYADHPLPIGYGQTISQP
jgi:hypothetical protein